VTIEQRLENLSRAKVWKMPETPIESADLANTVDEKWGYDINSEVTCVWDPRKAINGMTEKFFCNTEDGKQIKVKYSLKKPNLEIQNEVLGTRLLAALGFGADKMFLVRKVTCIGCPSDPFKVARSYTRGDEVTRAEIAARYGRRISKTQVQFPNLEKSVTFEWVAIEKKLKGPKIESEEDEGWKWQEVGQIAESKGGASVAEVDALAIMLRFIMNSDFKGENQRIKCLSGKLVNGYCEEPMAYMQDVGVAFGEGWDGLLGGGHDRLNLKGWTKEPFWQNRSTCTIFMKASPKADDYSRQISEEGRQFAFSLLNKLSDQQISDWFTAARIINPLNRRVGSSVAPWVQAFKNKVREIGDGAPCPK
jgi:hypothetical protein